MAEHTMIKFLPCDPTDTSAMEELPDALSMEGYLLTYESINSFYARFQKTDDKKRYYHLMIPTIKTRSMDIINDEDHEITSQTIQEYKEKGMEYFGEGGGCMIFRTDQLHIVKEFCDICGYFDAKKAISYSIVSILLMIIPQFFYGRIISKLSM